MSDKNKKNKRQRKVRKKKRKINKVFVSAAAFLSAAAVVVFCFYHIAYETDYLNLKAIDVVGNEIYTKEHIIEKSGIELGKKIYNIDKSKIKESIEQEVYVKNARVVYEIPDRIYLGITERNEKYQILYKNEYLATDEEGVVLNVYNEKNELLTIETLTDVLYNIGEVIKFDGIENVNSVFDTMEYCNAQFGDEIINKITVAGADSLILDTEYGAKIKIDLNNDVKYQISFAIKIITDRLNNNFTVTSGLIDFTKGDSPVYIEDYKMEGTYE